MKEFASNRSARHDFDIIETYEAGIELLGFEVKSIKSGRMSISGSRVIIRGGEAWLLGSDIPPYQASNTPPTYDQKRTRRLLLKKKEISHLAGKTEEKGLTLVPLSVYSKERNIKVSVGLGRIRKRFDKRELIKKREVRRTIARTLRA